MDNSVRRQSGYSLCVTQTTPRLSIQGLTKSFDATVALRGVSLDVEPGRVHALLGANGAGKSTLIKILAGLHHADSGAVFVDGKDNTRGICFIHQDLGLVETMTVAESIAVTRGFPRRAGLIDKRALARMASDAIAVTGADIAVNSQIGTLSRADQSIVAIARAIDEHCKVLVLDEPTASLPAGDVAMLFGIIRSLAERGVSVVYVTHRLDEVFEITDDLTVLRDGQVVHSSPTKDLTRQGLVKLIIGHVPAVNTREARGTRGEKLVSVRNVRTSDHGPTIPAVDLHCGEILGLAGLRGSGQEVLGRGLAGIAELDCESITIDGTVVPKSTHLARVVGFASSRRELEGLAMTLTTRENLFINPGAAGRSPWSWNSSRHERTRATRLGDRLRLKPNTPDTVVGTLSGGNQQKVVLGRWLATDVRALVLEEPTMGIDVGARAEIYRLIRGVADDGLCVVAVSSDFEELSLLCDRVLVLDRGALAAELSGAALTLDNITYHSAGAGPEQGEVYEP